MNERRPHLAPAFSEDQTRQILARAAELDRLLAGRLSASAIRDAALQAGISEAAIEQAIREASGHQSVTAGVETPRQGWFARWSKVGAVFGLGALAGAAAGALEPFWGSSVTAPTCSAAIALSVVSAALAFDGREQRKLARFQTLNLLLWVSFAFGWGMLFPDPHVRSSEDFLSLLGLGVGGTAILGTAIVRLKIGLTKPSEAELQGAR